MSNHGSPIAPAGVHPADEVALEPSGSNGLKTLGILVCILTVCAAGWYAWVTWGKPGTGNTTAASQPATTQPARSASVLAAQASVGDLPIYINGLGTVTALNTVTVRTRVDGQLVKVAYQEGQSVKEGDLLAQVDPRPFEVQLEQAQGQFARDEALLKNAKLDLARYQAAKETVSQQVVDTASAQEEQYQAAIKVDQSAIDNANLQLTYCRITAPISGKVGLRLVDQGNMVHATDPSGLAVITQIQPITVVFTLSEDTLPQIQQARKTGAELVVDAYSRDRKRKLASGKLLAIDNQIDPATATLRLKATFNNDDFALYPNQFVNVRMLVDTKKAAVLVPSAAIQRSPQSTYVYVIKDDSTVEVRPITIGPSEGELTLVSQGLAPGETVVTDGVDKLQPGAKVTIRSVDAATTRRSR